MLTVPSQHCQPDIHCSYWQGATGQSMIAHVSNIELPVVSYNPSTQ